MSGHMSVLVKHSDYNSDIGLLFSLNNHTFVLDNYTVYISYTCTGPKIKQKFIVWDTDIVY